MRKRERLGEKAWWWLVGWAGLLPALPDGGWWLEVGGGGAAGLGWLGGGGCLDWMFGEWQCERR